MIRVEISFPSTLRMARGTVVAVLAGIGLNPLYACATCSATSAGAQYDLRAGVSHLTPGRSVSAISARPWRIETLIVPPLVVDLPQRAEESTKTPLHVLGQFWRVHSYRRIWREGTRCL